MNSENDKNIAALIHVAGIFFSFIPGLIVWLMKKDEEGYLVTQSKEALNFQITMLIAWVVAGFLNFALIGCILMPAVGIFNLVFCIIAALAARDGKDYRYPYALRLIK